MYNETYEDYIRNILGYPQVNEYGYSDFSGYNINQVESRNMEFEKYYPEIYKIVYPMVLKKCSNNRGVFSSKDIDLITDEIYQNLEADITDDEKRDKKIERTNLKESNEKRYNNSSLRDLIKILLIRELVGRPNRPPYNCPGFGPCPMPRPPIRPPFRPNGPFNRDNDLYEY